MANKTYFKATEFTNVKDLLLDAVKRFSEKTVFVIKNHKSVLYQMIVSELLPWINRE